MKRKIKQTILGFCIMILSPMLSGCDELGDVLSTLGDPIKFTRYEIVNGVGNSPEIYVWIKNISGKNIGRGVVFRVNLKQGNTIKKSVKMVYDRSLIPNEEVRVGSYLGGAMLYPLSYQEANSCTIEYTDVEIFE